MQQRNAQTDLVTDDTTLDGLLVNEGLSQEVGIGGDASSSTVGGAFADSELVVLLYLRTRTVMRQYVS